MLAGRALHYVFKVADRKATTLFYKEILGMKILRHEEFTEGCEAACNGPYDNRWSKTMVGYGPEDTHFAIELTYNYNVSEYEKGNDFIGITVRSQEAVARVKATNYPMEKVNDANEDVISVNAPGGYTFFLINDVQPKDKDPVEKVTLACSDLIKSLSFWKDILQMELYNQSVDSAVLGFCNSHTRLELQHIGQPLNRAQAYGRIAFSIPLANLPEVEKRVNENKFTVLTPMISLDTPGKATVTVVILADPDGHEICFVDDENFRKLSAVDPQGSALLDRYIEKDEARKK